MAVLHASIDLNLLVCIASPVSHSQPPTDSLHFMAMLPPDYVHQPNVVLAIDSYVFSFLFSVFLLALRIS